MDLQTTSVNVGGKDLIFETGKIAKQANGSVYIRIEDTVLFASACAKDEASAEIDFFPLRIDYQEKFSSAGKTLSGFIKREGRPAERETLLCRLIDRPLRPLFPSGYYNEVQVVVSVWSYDGVNAPDPHAICAASAALLISDIPFTKAVGAVRVSFIDDKFVINASVEEHAKSKMDLLLAGTEDAILMIEGYCDFLTEDQVLEAIETGHKSIQVICRALTEWQQKIGKEKKTDTIQPIPDKLMEAIQEHSRSLLKNVIALPGKFEREQAIKTIKESLFEQLLLGEEESEFSKRDATLAFKKFTSQVMREMILTQNVRPDGRKPTDIRKISIEQSLLPRTHGSSLFTRGETQAVAVCTIGSSSMGQRYETIKEADLQRFYLQYFFPPYSVGEVNRMGPPNRREVGHGKLAERSLLPTIPTEEEFPYSIRLESNITESNGSSSMASVCGGCLALMDSGVPVKTPISGIAMGLILEKENFTVLSDISGTEDSLGDMDFKIAGSGEGITAFQMDIKVEGITHDIMKKALYQAKEGRIHILSNMIEVCPTHKTELSKYAPRMVTIQVKAGKIATIIGPGGKQIRAIIEQTGVEIDINDDGLVSISGTDPEGVEKATQIVNGLIAEAKVGKSYSSKVVSIVDFGIFIEILPGKQGLCHISEIANERVTDIREYFKEGDTIEVKVIDINDRGQIKLSHKATL